MANEGYHEAIDELSDETRDMHRALTSLMEELEATDWYNQRHAAMLLEWIRRKDPAMDKELKDYLFTEKEIGHL